MPQDKVDTPPHSFEKPDSDPQAATPPPGPVAVCWRWVLALPPRIRRLVIAVALLVLLLFVVWTKVIPDPQKQDLISRLFGHSTEVAAGQADLVITVARRLDTSTSTQPSEAPQRLLRKATLLETMANGTSHRFEGDLLIEVPSGHLSEFQARCVSNCSSTPEGPVGDPPQNSPNWGMKPRWKGLTDDRVATRGGAGISHWKPDSVAPEWEVSALFTPAASSSPSRPVEVRTTVEIPIGVVYYGRAFEVAIPDEALDATIRIRIGSRTWNVRVGEQPVLEDPVELVRKDRQGGAVKYKYRLKPAREIDTTSYRVDR